MARSRGRPPCRPTLEALEDRRLLSASPSPNLRTIAYNLTHGRLYDEKIAALAYQNYLGRFPEPAGLNAWVADLQAGLRDEQLEAGFLGSPEYLTSHGGTLPRWIRGMYQDVLGRTPAETEVQLWLEAVAGGATVAQVAYGFTASPEREARKITADYEQYLGRAPEPGIVSVWVQAFANGASNEDIVAGFLASPEYLQKHGNGYAGWYPSAVEDAYAGLLLNDDWFRQNIQDAPLRLTVELASLDGQLDWNDLIALFREVESEGSVTAGQLQDLQHLVLASQDPGQITINGQPVTLSAALANLVSKVVDDNPPNAFFQGSPLGDLQVGSSPMQLEQLVDKWLLGLDHPAGAVSYDPTSGSLFGSAGPSYSDVWQGNLGDCYLLAGFAAVAARTPSAIESLFTYLGTGVDGSSVWAVRLYASGLPDYVTVDNLLPGGGSFYDHPTPVVNGPTATSILWAPLLEKAFAQEFGGDAYANLDTSQQPGGLALAGLTGQSAGWLSMDAATLASKIAQGAILYIGTGNSPGSSILVANHCYAVVSYNPGSSQPFVVFSPWGVNRGPFASQFNADAGFIDQNFTYFWTTA
jgi:hypothetical protein